MLGVVRRLKATPTALGDLTKSLGEGLWELRLKRVGDVSIRITYWIAPDKRIILLTVFDKTRMNERKQVQRAKKALQVCRAGAHPHLAALETYQRYEDE